MIGPDVRKPRFVGERRQCCAEKPMPMEDKDKYAWTHQGAVYVRPFFNLAIYTCPHCGLTFHALPPPAAPSTAPPA